MQSDDPLQLFLCSYRSRPTAGPKRSPSKIGSLRVKYGRSVTPQVCLIADIAPAIKPRMCQKYGVRLASPAVINSPKTGNESHSPLARAHFCFPRGDAIAGVAAHAVAWHTRD